MYHQKGRQRLQRLASKVDDGRTIRSLTQVMAAQSLYLGNMVRARRENNAAAVYENWHKMETLNGPWVDLLMTPFLYRSRVKPSDERLHRLHTVASQMTGGYTSTLAELILFGRVSPERLNRLIGAEADFYNTMMGANSEQQRQTKEQWFSHTQSVLDMMHFSDAQRYADDDFDWAAANCIEHGQLLGTWLDGVFMGY